MDGNVVTSDDGDAHLEIRHTPLRPKHAHSHVHRNLKRKREPMGKRQVQTALDVIVVSGGTTAGDVLLASIPNNPTTASLPGFGLLTISTFIPGAPTASPSTTSATATTGSAASESAPAPTAAATMSSLTPSMTGLNSTISSSSSQTSMMYNVGVATSYNGTSTASGASPYLNSSMASSTFSGMSSSSSGSTSVTSFATSTSASTSSASTSASSTGSGGVIGGAAGAPTGSTGSQPTADASAGNGNSMAGPIAGGVVGGIAGAALLAVLLIVLLRLWRKRQDRGQRLVGSPADEEGTSAPGAATAASPAMTQRSSLAPLAAAIHRFRPASTQTAASSSTAGAAVPAERGFQKISGRKLTSVLQSGGDGFGEPAGRPESLVPPPVAYGPNRESNLSGTSFLRDSNSHYGGSNTNSRQYNSNPFEDAGASTAAVGSRNMQPAPSDSSIAAHASASNRGSSIYDAPRSGNPFATPDARADRALQVFSSSPGSTSSDGIRSPTPDINETLTVHQGPVRTPVIAGTNFPAPPIPSRRPGHGVDGLGRSRPSWDGSRHSRFSEAI